MNLVNIIETPKSPIHYKNIRYPNYFPSTRSPRARVKIQHPRLRTALPTERRPSIFITRRTRNSHSPCSFNLLSESSDSFKSLCTASGSDSIATGVRSPASRQLCQTGRRPRRGDPFTTRTRARLASKTDKTAARPPSPGPPSRRT